MYKVIKLWGDKSDEKVLTDLIDEWDLIAIVPMLGKVEPHKDISATEYTTWPVAYLKKRPKRIS